MKPKKRKLTFVIFGTWRDIPSNPSVVDATKLDVSEEELLMCIHEQVYGQLAQSLRDKRKGREKPV